MAITTYDELKTAVQVWLDNNNTNVVAAIPDAISMAHARMSRVLRTWEMEARLELEITPDGVLEADLGYYDLPADWGGVKSVVRRPDTLNVTYWARIPELSDVITTNWLLDKHPDVYLYGSLMELSGFAKSELEIKRWSQAYTTTLEEIVSQDWNDSFPDGLVVHTRVQASDVDNGTLLYVPAQEYDSIETIEELPSRYEPGVYTISAGQIRIWPKPEMPEP